jgi:hypothetical protein
MIASAGDRRRGVIVALEWSGKAAGSTPSLRARVARRRRLGGGSGLKPLLQGHAAEDEPPAETNHRRRIASFE